MPFRPHCSPPSHPCVTARPPIACTSCTLQLTTPPSSSPAPSTSSPVTSSHRSASFDLVSSLLPSYHCPPAVRGCASWDTLCSHSPPPSCRHVLFQYLARVDCLARARVDCPARARFPAVHFSAAPCLSLHVVIDCMRLLTTLLCSTTFRSSESNSESSMHVGRVPLGISLAAPVVTERLVFPSGMFWVVSLTTAFPLPLPPLLPSQSPIPSFPHQRQAAHLLAHIRRAVSHPWQRLPSLSLVLAAETLCAMQFAAGTPLCSLLTHSLVTKPCLEINVRGGKGREEEGRRVWGL